MFDWLNLFGATTALPRVHVATAIVARPAPWRYLVTFNPRWRAYSFPCKKIPLPPTGDPLRDRRIAIDTARDAFLEALGHPLGLSSTGRWMDRIEVQGVSGRTDRPCVYQYDIIHVDPAHEIPDGSFASRHGFLTADEVRHSDPAEPGPLARLVTWTTWQVLTRLLDNQQVAVAIVRRGDDYLMVPNRYGQWFFPARRMGDGRPSWQAVINDFREWNINLKMELAGEQALDLTQDTNHLGPRDYRFHLCAVRVDPDALAAELSQRNVPHAWRPLDDNTAELSPTLDALRDVVRQLP